MIVVIAAVYMIECIKADDGYSVFTSVVADSISPHSESIRSPFKIPCYLLCFMKTENHSNLQILFVQGPHQESDFPFWGIFHSVSSYNILVLLFGFLWKHCEVLAKFFPTIKLLVFIFVVIQTVILLYFLNKNLCGYHWCMAPRCWITKICKWWRSRKEIHCRLQLIISIVTIATEVVSIKFSIVTWSSLDRHDRRDITSFYLHDCGDPDRHDRH